MSRKPDTKRLWEIRVTTSPEAGDAVSYLLECLTQQPASSYHDLRRQQLLTSAYLHNLPAEPNTLRQQISAGLEKIHQAGITTKPGRITIRPIQQKDWAESWKDHFPPLEIAGKLLIIPDWIKPKPKRAQQVVVLNPGLSFGTGHHPTTQFCLEELLHARKPSSQQSLLDIGTGSGLLAIAAAKLGFSPIKAFDFDPLAVRIAKTNARQNHVGRKIRIQEADLTALANPLPPHNVVCANLQADLLISQKKAIAQAVSPGGILILAGILHKEMPLVRHAYISLGFRSLKTRRRKEWSSASLTLPA